jgi:methyl-accepting chemotaxis protein
MQTSTIELLLTIFVAIAGVGVLLQGSVLFGIFLVVRKAVATGKAEADEYRAKLTPLIETGSQLITTGKDLVASTETLINELRPEIKTAAAELSDMVRDIHTQVNRLQVSVDEVTQKARRQADRVDHMTTSVLNGLDRFGGFVNEAVNLPVRQVSGIVAAARAVVDTLRAPAPQRPRRVPQPVTIGDDKDLFV